MKLLDRIINTKRADPESLLIAALIVSAFMDKDKEFVTSGGLRFCLAYLGGSDYHNDVEDRFDDLCELLSEQDDE